MIEFKEAVSQAAACESSVRILTDWIEIGCVKGIPLNSPAWQEAVKIGEEVRAGKSDGLEWFDSQLDKCPGLREELAKVRAQLARREKTGRRIQFLMRSIEADQQVTLRAWCRLAKYPVREIGGKNAYCVGRNASHSFYLAFDGGKMFRGACGDGSVSWAEVQPSSPEYKNLRWDTGYIGH